MTTVVNIRKSELNKRGYANFQEWESKPDHVYIGRRIHYVNAPQSKWYNPFSVEKYGRNGACIQYEQYIRTNNNLMDALEELRGKELGCWCKPERCHGDVLIKLLEEKKSI